MSLNLPERASYDYLKKLAKERLVLLRAANPATQLADAQRAIAREYGFASWRALKAEIDRRREPRIAAFMQACRAGDVEALRELLQDDPGLARERLAAGSHGLHLAFRHPDALRLLIAHGADPNVRDLGDNASPLHLAAANAELESVRVILDAGADAQGTGDVHNGDVIGWAMREGNEAVIQLLLERGARHHIFSAMALGAGVEKDAHALELGIRGRQVKRAGVVADVAYVGIGAMGNEEPQCVRMAKLRGVVHDCRRRGARARARDHPAGVRAVPATSPALHACMNAAILGSRRRSSSAFSARQLAKPLSPRAIARWASASCVAGFATRNNTKPFLRKFLEVVV